MLLEVRSGAPSSVACPPLVRCTAILSSTSCTRAGSCASRYHQLLPRRLNCARSTRRAPIKDKDSRWCRSPARSADPLPDNPYWLTDGRIDVWRCLDQEETRRSPQPVSRRGLHVSRLLDDIQRHGLSCAYSKLHWLHAPRQSFRVTTNLPSSSEFAHEKSLTLCTVLHHGGSEIPRVRCIEKSLPRQRNESLSQSWSPQIRMRWCHIRHTSKKSPDYEDPPHAPTPPSAVPNNRDSVFDYMVDEGHTRHSPKIQFSKKSREEMAMKNGAPSVFSDSRASSRSGYRNNEERVHSQDYTENGFSYGTEPVNPRPYNDVNPSYASLDFMTPSARSHKATNWKARSRPSLGHSRQNSGSEKKRKRGQTDPNGMENDTPMADVDGATRHSREHTFCEALWSHWWTEQDDVRRK